MTTNGYLGVAPALYPLQTADVVPAIDQLTSGRVIGRGTITTTQASLAVALDQAFEAWRLEIIHLVPAADAVASEFVLSHNAGTSDLGVAASGTPYSSAGIFVDHTSATPVGGVVAAGAAAPLTANAESDGVSSMTTMIRVIKPHANETFVNFETRTTLMMSTGARRMAMTSGTVATATAGRSPNLITVRYQGTSIARCRWRLIGEEF
jgi:hypothetical protein